MKCQKCDKSATFHITELADGKPHEIHLCEEHARAYLSKGMEQTEDVENLAAVFAQQLAQQGIGQAAKDLSQLDKKKCPYCGGSFYEFREKGRLGCPHDYTFFASHLEPLLVNIHGDTEHVGKTPSHGVEASQERTELLRLRREMDEAVQAERYEDASRIRDEIRRIRGEEKDK